MTRTRGILLLAAVAIAAGSCRPGPERAPVAAADTTPAALAAATQLVVVTTADWDATAGELQRFARADRSAPWQAVDSAVPIVVGRTGLAWGHGYDAFAGSGPRKMEGDGRTPAGAFPLGTAFGFAPADSMRSVRMPYLQLTPGSECVDDTASDRYNQVLDRATIRRVDWASSERMRSVEQYRLGVIVDYNPVPAAKGRGSCIFLHIWAGPASTTVGCTALDESDLARLIAWLDPGAHPAIVQLPIAAYESVRAAWGLPLR